MTSDTAAVREGEDLDWEKLEGWLKANIDDLVGEMKVSQFHGGHANLTYCISFDNTELVIRRQPFGKIAPGAHDMKREYRALSGLCTVFDRAPKAYAYCDDETIIGAAFIVMERRQGLIVRADIPAGFRDIDNIEERLSFALIDAMAELHELEPGSVGLDRLGRAEGFVSRQLKGWHDRWQLVVDHRDDEFEKAYELLVKHQPESRRNTLVHNDLKLDNCMFEPGNPDRVSTILDWDMTTLGDPLIELGTLLSYWQQSDDAFDRSPTIDLDMSAFPARQQLVDRYAAHGGDIENIAWYEAFGLWKQAVVLQQLYRRFEVGETQDQRFSKFPGHIPDMLNEVQVILRHHKDIIGAS